MKFYSPAVLASLLPGLRDIRTPLATGYLWLLGLWLFLADRVPADLADLTGPAADVYRLTQILGSAAGLAATSFVAYIIGSILLLPPVSVPTAYIRAHMNLSALVSIRGVSISLRERVVNRTFGRLWAGRQEQLKSLLGLAATEQMNDLLDSGYDGQKIDAEVRRSIGATGMPAELDDVDRLALGRQGYLYFIPNTHRTRYESKVLSPFLTIAIWNELNAVSVQLQAKNHDMWDSFDRHEAEAQFRFGIAPPLIFVIIGYAFRSSGAIGYLWLLLLVVPAVLLILGTYEQLRASEVLAQAVNLKLVSSPIQEKLESLRTAPPTAEI